MLPKYDLHIHTNYSDGSQTFEEILIKIEEVDLKCFGISDHFEKGHNHSVSTSANEYYNHFLKIKNIAKEKGIIMLLGAEVGFNDKEILIPENIPNVDYIIGSIHQMPQNLEEEDYWDLYKKYVEKAVSEYSFQILGHVEGYLPVNKFMKPDSTFEDRRSFEKLVAIKYLNLEWYKEIAKEMAKNKIALEIHEMSESPRKEVIKIMIENGVKLSYGTDSHALHQLSKRNYFSEVTEQLGLKEKEFLKIEDLFNS